MNRWNLTELRQYFVDQRLEPPIGSGADGRILRRDYLAILKRPPRKISIYTEGYIFNIALRLPVTKIERLSLVNVGFRRLLFNNHFWKKKLALDGHVVQHNGVTNYYLYFLLIRSRSGFLKYRDQRLRDFSIGQRALVDYQPTPEYVEENGYLLSDLGEVTTRYSSIVLLRKVKSISYLPGMLINLHFNGDLGRYYGGRSTIVKSGVQQLFGWIILDTRGEIFEIVDYESDSFEYIEYDKTIKCANIIPYEQGYLATSVDGGLYLLERNRLTSIGGKGEGAEINFVSATTANNQYYALDLQGRLWIKPQAIRDGDWRLINQPAPIVWIDGDYRFSINDVGELPRNNDHRVTGLNRYQLRGRYKHEYFWYFNTKKNREEDE